MSSISPSSSNHDLTQHSASLHTALLPSPSPASLLSNPRSRRYVLGLVYLGIVIFLWVASSAV